MDQALAILQDLTTQAEAWALRLTRPWGYIQIGIIIALWLASVLFARLIEPRANTWIRSLKGLSASQLRLMITLRQKTGLILFSLLAFLVAKVIAGYTWPSRSYLIGLAATLAAAFVVVTMATRLIKNPLMRSLIRWGMLAWVTLTLLGLWDSAQNVLDQAVLDIGEVRISALIVGKAALFMLVLLTLAGWASRWSATRLRAIDDLSPSMRVLSEKVVTILLYGIAVVFAVRSVGFDLTSLAVLSGAIGIGVGFGLQKVVSNFVSGFILLLDKSIKPGDVISIGDTFGWIQSLSARYVSVVTRDGREFLIPNEDLITGQVVNWSHSNDLVRLEVNFGVSYDADPHLVRKIAADACATVERVQSDPPPQCHVVGFGDSSVDFMLRFWISDPSAGLANVRGRVFLAIWDVLKENSIDIPFPRRDVTILNHNLPQD